LEATPRRRLFTLLGVEWLATPTAWIGPIAFLLLGVVTGELAHAELPAEGRLPRGVGYGVLLYLANTVHSVGHILAGRLAGAPMNANLLTATREVNLYLGERARVSPSVRAARALGGPLANLALGAALWLAGRVAGWGWLKIGGLMSLGVGLWTVAPVPTMDGWILWRWALGRARSRR
jgi:hypothetical protein